MAQQKKGMSSRRLAVNSIAAVSSEILGMIALLWVNQFLLRRIGAEEYALVPVVTSLMFFGEFLRTIFTSGLARFMVEEDTRGNDAGVTRIASSMIPVLGLVALFFGLLGALAVWKIDRVIAVDPANIGSARLMLGLMVATFCLSIATMPLSAGLYVKMRFVEHYLVDLSMEMLRIVLLLGLLFGIGPEARWVTVALCISGVTGIVIRLVYTRAILPAARFEASAVSLDCVKTLLSFSMWTSVQSFTLFVQRAAPALLLNRHSTALDVANFYVGNLPNLQIQKLVQVVTVASTAELTALYALKGETALRPLYYRGGRYFLWGSLFLVPPLVAFSKQLITLYVGAEFLQAALVMVVVLAIYPFSFASSMYHRIAYAVGRIRAYNMYSVLLSLVALAFMYVFVVKLEKGAAGAAYGLASGFILVQVTVIWPMGLRMVHGNFREFILRTLAPGLSPFIVSLLTGLIFANLVAIDSWWLFIAGCLACGVAYALALFGACLEAEDRALLGRVISRLGGTSRT